MVAILMMSAKMAVLDLLKIEIFWNKGYDVKIYVHDVINQVLLHESIHIVDVVMWPHNLSFIRIWTEKPLFSRGGLDWSSII